MLCRNFTYYVEYTSVHYITSIIYEVYKTFDKCNIIQCKRSCLDAGYR